ncbi:MAG: zinc-binding alcohol dehydrogenase [Candidatus Latescibacteria bacterium]|nr:zinc-binding alcohol dehydrogenase [Candidatus Latescibacterota bacterium]
MKTRQLVVLEPGRIEVQEQELDETLKPNEALVQSEYTIVSAGTEGAGFTGLVKEMPFGDGGQYPRTTGYGNLGRVLSVGSGVSMCKPGDRVLSFSRHASVVKADAGRMALPISASAPGQHLVFARMAGVSIAALRSATVQPGDTVLVIGMGLVGNFAAQLFQQAGAEVMATDLAQFRLDRAKACGIGRVVNSAKENLEEAVKEWTGGRGAHVVVEAIGRSEVIAQAVMLTRRYGEVILLGSPRAKATFDATPMLLRLHLEAIRMIGALEWRWPQHETERVRDLSANYRMLAEWIAAGRLQVAPLLTHLATPDQCQQIYDGLAGKKEEFLGAVFDWNPR